MGRAIPPVPTWRLQPATLADPVFRDSLETHIIEYFEANEGTAVNTIVEWEAFKAVTRGICIGKTVGIRRQIEIKLIKMENQLKELQTEMVTNGDKKLELEECKSEYSILIEKLRCHNHQQYILCAHNEEGKAGRVLAQLVRRENRGDPITNDILEDGTLGHTQAKINGAFTDYYRDLCAAPSHWDEEN